MMRKLLVKMIAVMLTVLVIKNLWICCGFNTLNDEEIMNNYIAENYNERCYGVLQDCNDDKYVKFVVYENGCVRSTATLAKDYYGE